jgi:hypothetical protein
MKKYSPAFEKALDSVTNMAIDSMHTSSLNALDFVLSSCRGQNNNLTKLQEVSRIMSNSVLPDSKKLMKERENERHG